MGKLMIGRAETRALIKKVVLIGFPYTNKDDTGRGIDRYLAIVHKSFVEHGINLKIIENGLVRPKLVQFLKSFLKVLIALWKSEGDLYHAVDPLGSVVAALAQKRNIVTTIHDTIPIDGKVKMFNPFVFLLMKLSMLVSLNISKEIIVPFSSTKDTLIKNFNVPDKKITVIHYALDLNLKPSVKLNNSQKVNYNNIKIVFMGGGSPNDRGLEIVLRSYILLVKDFSSASLTIVARKENISDENWKLLNYAKFGHITTLDFIPEPKLLSFLKEFSVFVYPSRLGFSFLVMQAIAAGLPVVTSSTRDMKDFLGDTAIMCDNDEIGCYLEALVKLTDRDFRTNIIKKQYERLQLFTLNHFYSEMCEFYSRSMCED